MWHDRDNGMDLVEANFGDLVTVMGRISTFREERQMTISTLRILVVCRVCIAMENAHC